MKGERKLQSKWWNGIVKSVVERKEAERKDVLEKKKGTVKKICKETYKDKELKEEYIRVQIR